MAVFNNILAGSSGQAVGGGAYEIERSLRFNSDDSAYLSKDFASAGNRRTWTLSFWFKKAQSAATLDYVFGASSDGFANNYALLVLGTQFEWQEVHAGSVVVRKTAAPAIRDHSAWMHILINFDTNNSTADDAFRIYINGTRITAFTPHNINPSFELDGLLNSDIDHYWGYSNSSFSTNCYLADIHFIDGQALDPTSFTEVSATTGQLVPIAYSGTYGTNGFHLPFSDNSTAAALGTDTSGNGNDWTPNNLAVVGSNTVWDTKADGTNWTNIANAFDGSTSTYADGTYNNGTTSRIRFNTPLTGVTKLRLYWGGTSTYGYNNTTVGTGPASSSPDWVTAYTGTAITVDSIIGVSQAGDGVVQLYAVEVNDSIITGYSRSNPAGNDSLVDTPTSYGTDTGAGGEVRGNYCTLNPLDKGGGASAVNGNLDLSLGSAGSIRSTIGFSSGKWYWEATAGASSLTVGIAKAGTALSAYLGSQANEWSYGQNGTKITNGSGTSYGATFTTADVIGVAFDADNGTLTFYKNGSSQGIAFTGLTSGPYFPAIGDNSATSGHASNFGQRPFAYTAPSGFKALCDTNLPAPVVAKPSEVMDVLLWTGTSTSSARTISGLQFSPDLVWTKGRSQAYNNQLWDVVRGTGLELVSNSTAKELTNNQYGYLSAFNSDGFSATPGSTDNSFFNELDTTYAAWCWDAGTSTVTNTQGSITSTVRANPTAGFSIVTYSGVDTPSTNTVGHGLGVAPALWIIKNRTNTSPQGWVVNFTVLDGSVDYMYLNLTNAKADQGSPWNTLPTSTVFTLGANDGNTCDLDSDYVAYCFAPVAGYSAFGSYTGNGLADGPFVYTGFRPRWVMFKRSDSTSDWIIYDTSRDAYNVMGKPLYPSLANAEADSPPRVDYLSNGFKLRVGGSSEPNWSGSTVIYATFAESPFQYARAR